MMFLLFYYTDSIDLPIGIAATTYLIASVWDGIANFGAGMLLERRQSTIRYGTLIAIGGLPLGLSFVLMYLPPLAKGPVGIGIVFVAHLLFRTAYAAVNVPYLAMTARISQEPADRAFVAGARMLFGTAAAVVIALTTMPFGQMLVGAAEPKRVFAAAAILFAVAGSAILALVGVTYREQVTLSRPPPRDMRAALASLARNRGFVALNAAMMAVIVANTVLGKSVLYYFKYILGDVGAGQVALALTFIVSAVAIPLWMLFGRAVGLRLLWLFATVGGMIALIFFAGVGISNIRGLQGFLIVMQVVNIGLNYVFWAMLPNTIEYGEDATGVHVEGSVFGVAALLQRIAIGIATAILGLGFASAGYVANSSQSAATLTGMRATVAFVPLIFFALASAAMLMNPLGGGVRRKAGRELAEIA
jgi:GPH family glycoside/pentoside/hexuronide:cation symporter